MAARRRDRVPEFRRGEGIADARAHLLHQRPGRVRRRLSAARLGVGRKRPARLYRRSAGAAGRHPQRIDAAALAGDAAERSAVIGRQFATAAAAASGRAAIVSVAALPAAVISAAVISAAAVSATRIPIGNTGRATVVAQSARLGAARRRRGFGRPRRPAASLLRRPHRALHAGAAERRSTAAAARTAARAAGHRLGRTGRSETARRRSPARSSRSSISGSRPRCSRRR